MPECPDCHSIEVVSKGFSPNGAKRYICKNCKRNFTVSDKKPEEKKEPKNNLKTTITIDKDIVEYLEGKKIISQEPIGQVIRRLLNIS